MSIHTYLKFNIFLFLLLIQSSFAIAQTNSQVYHRCGKDSTATAAVQQAHALVASMRENNPNFISEANRAVGLHKWESDPYNIDFDYARMLNAIWLIKNAGSGPQIGDGLDYVARRIHKTRPKCDLHTTCSDSDNACFHFGYVHDGGLDFDKEYRVEFRRGYVFESSPLKLASTLIHEAQHFHTNFSDVAGGSIHPGWAAQGPYAKEFMWLAWFAANGTPKGFSDADTIQFREDAADLANDINRDEGLGQEEVVHNPVLNLSPINLDGAWSLPFPQTYPLVQPNVPYYLGDPWYSHEAWGIQAECRAPANHVVTGFGGRITNDNRITTLHLNVREVVPTTGRLGSVRRIRCGTDPNHGLELFVNLPNGYVLTGLGGRVYKNNFSGLTAYAREWKPDAGGLSSTQRKFVVGSSSIEMKYDSAPVKSAVVGIGLRNYQSNIRGLSVFLREMVSPPPTSTGSGSSDTDANAGTVLFSTHCRGQECSGAGNRCGELGGIASYDAGVLTCRAK